MPDLFCIMNHELTAEQLTEARKRFGIETVHELPADLKRYWENVPPEGELMTEELRQLLVWLDTNVQPGDYIIIQGEYGASWLIVDFCFTRGFIPIYATSKRESREQRIGIEKKIKMHIFRHVQFRKYQRWEK
jgi:hypothetical protein